MKRLFTRGMPSGLLIAFYLLISILPLVLIALVIVPQRLFQDELASYFGIMGLAWLLLSFLLSGRFRSISGRIGIDRTMRAHQIMAIGLGLIILLHPYLYTLPVNQPIPWDTTGQHSLNLDTPSFITGMIAWILLPVLVITAIFRDQLPCRYETWRLLHGISAVIIAAAAVHHALSAGRYSGHISLTVFWLGLTGVSTLTLIRSYVAMPLLQSRRPYQVTAVEPVATRTWHVTIEPAQASNFTFEAGQFVWLKFGGSPFTLTEHPFSISSSPSDLPKLRFTIKESGDFTGQIGKIINGSRAFIDGPHGHFVLGDQQHRGIVFIAGGVGIAPIISIITELAHQNYSLPVKLVYGNRIKSQITFQDELEKAAKKLELNLNYVLSEPPPDWKAATGFIDSELIAATIDKQQPEEWLYFLCGPPAMLQSAVKTLKSAGIPSRQIVYEQFSYL